MSWLRSAAGLPLAYTVEACRAVVTAGPRKVDADTPARGCLIGVIGEDVGDGAAGVDSEVGAGPEQ